MSWAPGLEGSEVHCLTVGPPLSALVPEAAFAWELPPEGQVYHCVPRPSSLSLRGFRLLCGDGAMPFGLSLRSPNLKGGVRLHLVQIVEGS